MTTPLAGLKVTSWPVRSTAVHCACPVTQLTDCRPPAWSTRVAPAALTVPVAGLKVTSLPVRSTAVHWLAEGHDTEVMTPSPPARLAPSSGTSPEAFGFPVCGSNVSSLPLPSTTVHCCADGHDTEETPLTVAESSEVTPAAPTWPVSGLKVTSVS